MQMDTALDFLEIPMAQCGMGNAQLTLSGQERQRGMKQTSMEGALWGTRSDSPRPMLKTKQGDGCLRCPWRQMGHEWLHVQFLGTVRSPSPHPQPQE